jgi:two-component sensor histidine kinase
MAQEAIGQPIYIVIPSDRHDEEPAMLERIARGEHIQHYETVRTRKDGSSVDISLTVSPLTDAGGKFIGTSKIARDITARKQEDQRRQLLIGELNHRVKNTLATVQSIAAQTFRGQGIEQSKRFERRLIALAAAHDVLTRGYWESADLNEIATAVVSPCVSPVSRFAISGPAVRLTPKMAVSLAMVLHELCTNALKYGALSDQSGLVRLSWNETGVDDGRKLHLRWEESGGPEVVAPTRKGFGTRMIEQVLAREVGAPVSLSFRTSGVICEMEIPLS